MTTSPEFLVFGATGQQGGAVARALIAKGRTVRAFVRDPQSDQSKALEAEGVTLAVGDLFDRDSIDRAMVGIKGVFSVQTSSPSGVLTDEEEVQQGKSVADSAVAAGVGHLVYSSTGAVGSGVTGMGHFDSKAEIESHIQALPIAATITRPASFMEMMMLPGLGLNTGVYTFFMHPEQTMQMIALHDLGRVNAEILCSPDRYAGKVVELSGQAISGTYLARAFTQAAGHEIAYQRFSDDFLASNGFMRKLTDLVDNGVVAGKADIPALEAEFGAMMTLDAWLAGPGAPLFKAALTAAQSDVALR